MEGEGRMQKDLSRDVFSARDLISLALCKALEHKLYQS